MAVRILIFILIFINIYTLYSQKDSTFYKTDTVKVEAIHSVTDLNTTPLSVSYVERSQEEMDSEPAQTLNQITRHIPGIFVNDRENYSLGEKISIRGVGWRSAFGVRGIQVILDGVPLTMPDGQSGMNIIDPAVVSSIEILRGPASTFWGNAAGGVILLNTRPANTDDFMLKLRTQSGTFGSRNYLLQFNSPLESGYISGYYSNINTDGYRNYSSAELHRAGLTGKFELRDNLDLSISAAFLSMPFAENPGSLNLELAQNDPRSSRESFINSKAGKELLQGQFGSSLNWGTSIGEVRLLGYHIIRQLDNPLTFAYIDINRNAGGGRLTLNNDKGLFNWNIGAEVKYQFDERLETNNNGGNKGEQIFTNQNEDVISRSAFAYVKYPINNFYFSLGGRYDNISFTLEDKLLENGNQSGSRTFDAFNYSAGIGYKTGTHNIFVNTGTAFQAPTTTELENSPNLSVGFNRDIKPENILSVELGSRGFFNTLNLKYDIAVFSMNTEDMLIAYQGDNDQIFYRNQDEVNNTGIELALIYFLNNTLEAGLSYTFNNAEFTNAMQDSIELTGNKVPGIPEQLLNPFVRINIESIRVQLDYTFVGNYFVNNENTAQNRNYNLFDIRINHSGVELTDYAELVPFISVFNVFDERYNSSVIVNARGGNYFEPGAGRSIRTGFSLTFK